MADPLQSYRAKRVEGATPEPEGAPPGAEDGAGAPRFVIHEHHASHLHWDLRLERKGVLASWALPKGVPSHPDENRLAVHTEDHPLDYLDFEGEIPKGSYGGGTMHVWDRGTYECDKFRANEVIVVLHGERVSGRYALFQTRGKNWMIHRMDPPADSERVLMPDNLRPMLPKRGRMPRKADEFGFEIAWGGLRTMLWSEPGHIRKAEARGLEDPGMRFPEVRRIARVLGSTEAVLDGEIVVLDGDGQPDASSLRDRKRASSDSVARRLARQKPATLMLFDLLFVDGRPLLDLPYEERRRELEALDLNGYALSLIHI